MAAHLKTTILITCLLNLSLCTSQGTADVRSACEYACLNVDQKTTSGVCVLQCIDSLLHRLGENALESLLRNVKEEKMSQMENLSNFETDLDNGDDRSYRENLLRRGPMMSRRGGGIGGGASFRPTGTKKKVRSRKPHYLRVGRQRDNTNYDFVDLLVNDYNDKIYDKRASRIVRSGKSTLSSSSSSSSEGVITAEGQRLDEIDVEKKNVRPSKYIRIGKRNVETKEKKIN